MDLTKTVTTRSKVVITTLETRTFVYFIEYFLCHTRSFFSDGPDFVPSKLDPGRDVYWVYPVTFVQ